MKMMSKTFLAVWFRSQQSSLVPTSQCVFRLILLFWFWFLQEGSGKIERFNLMPFLSACQYFIIVKEKACFSLNESMIWVNVQCLSHSQLKLTYSCNIHFYLFNNIGFYFIRINFKNSNYQILRVKLVHIALTVLRNFAIFSFFWAANILFVSSFQIVK